MPRVLACVADLMFRSKILEAAKAAGAEISFARDKAGAMEAADIILVDLNDARLAPLEIVAAIRGRAARIIGFAGHTETETMRRAAELGCTDVMTRGQFAAKLPELLSEKK